MTAHLVTALILFAAWVVVPLAQPLTQIRAAWVLSAASLTLSFWVDDPVWAAGLSVPWLLFAVRYALPSTLAFLRRPRWRLAALLELSAPLHLIVAAIWVPLAHLDMGPDGYPGIIAPLTAVHFSYAGFAAAHLTARALTHLHPPHARLARVGGCLLLVGVPALAIGFITSPLLKCIAACAISVGMLVVSLASLPKVRHRPWLRISWAALPVSMILSLAYAVGEHSGTWWLTIPDMAWTHGLLNGLVFAGCGLYGWRKDPA
ncbi:MAG: hypothetical protein ACI9U2_003047 [Bradymonadia bacterium]|jgi:hypothetical protein